jgi:predicted acetyltransferase
MNLRRRGIGTQLLKLAIEIAKQCDVDRIYENAEKRKLPKSS